MKLTGPGTLPSNRRSVSPIGVNDAPAVAAPVGTCVNPIWGAVIGTNCWHCGVLTAWNLYTFPSGKVTLTKWFFNGCRQYVGKKPLHFVSSSHPVPIAPPVFC